MHEIRVKVADGAIRSQAWEANATFGILRVNNARRTDNLCASVLGNALIGRDQHGLNTALVEVIEGAADNAYNAVNFRQECFRSQDYLHSELTDCETIHKFNHCC